MTGYHQSRTGVLVRLRSLIPPTARETWYRVAVALVALLASRVGLSDPKIAVWTQLALATVTLIFAALHATTPFRVALYLMIVAVGGAFTVYGIVSDDVAALIGATVAQLFGLATAAAKTVQVVNGDVDSSRVV